MIPTTIPCERHAYLTLARDAGLFGVSALMFMIGFSFEPALALDIGATVALAYAVILLIRARRLTEARFRQSEFWQALPVHERPAGGLGVRIAHGVMQNLMLRFAKTASGAAVVMYGSGLLLSALIGVDAL